MTIIASDTFTRANQTGWGTASDGTDTWSQAAGSYTNNIVSNQGELTGSTAINFMQLGTQTSADMEMLVRLTGSNPTLSQAKCILRATGSATYYRMGMGTTATKFVIDINNAGTITNLALAAVTAFVANTEYWIRARVQGTNLYARVWQDGTTEPTSWTATATNSTITAAGNFGVGLVSGSSTGTTYFDNLTLDNLATASNMSGTDTLTSDDSASTFTESFFAIDTGTVSEVLLATDIFLSSDIASVLESYAEAETFVPVESLSVTDTPLFLDTLSTIDTTTASDTVSFSHSNFITGTDTLSCIDILSAIEIFVPLETATALDSDQIASADFVETIALSDNVAVSDALVYTVSIIGWSTGAEQLVLDSFNRTVAQGTSFGTATDGQVWSNSTSTAVQCSVASSKGTFTATGANPYNAVYIGLQEADIELLSRISLPATTQLEGYTFRSSSTANTNTCYQMYYYNGNVEIDKFIAGTQTSLGTKAFTLTANTEYWIRGRICGTFLGFKIWRDGTVEPAAWTLQLIDSSITAAGYYGYADSFTSTGTGTVDTLYGFDYALSDKVVPLDSIAFVVYTPTSQMSGTDTLTANELESATLATLQNDVSTDSDIFSSILTVTASDNSTASESVQDTLIYTPTETGMLSESASGTLTLLLRDTGSVSDTLTASLSETLSDALVAAETLLMLLAQASVSNATLNEVFTSTLSVQSVDNDSLADAYTTLLSLSISESNILAENGLFLLTQSEIDTASVSDMLSVLSNVTHVFLDVSLSPVDTALLSLLSNQADVGSAAESGQVAIDVQAIETLAVLDALFFGVVAAFSDACLVQERSVALLSRSFAENALSLTEIGISTFNIASTDALLSGDAVALVLTSMLLDTSISSDSLAFLSGVFTVLPVDSVTVIENSVATEIVLSQDTLSPSEQATVTLGEAFLDNVFTSENNVYALLQTASDIALNAIETDAVTSAYIPVDSLVVFDVETAWAALSVIDTALLAFADSVLSTEIAYSIDTQTSVQESVAYTLLLRQNEQLNESETVSVALVSAYSDMLSSLDTLAITQSWLPIDVTPLSENLSLALFLSQSENLTVAENAMLALSYSSIESGLTQEGAAFALSLSLVESDALLTDALLFSAFLASVDTVLSVELLSMLLGTSLFTAALLVSFDSLISTESVTATDTLAGYEQSLEILTATLGEHAVVSDQSASLLSYNTVDQSLSVDTFTVTLGSFDSTALSAYDALLSVAAYVSTDTVIDSELLTLLLVFSVLENSISQETGSVTQQQRSYDTLFSTDSFFTTGIVAPTDALLAQDGLMLLLAQNWQDAVASSDGPLGVGYQFVADTLLALENLSYSVEAYEIIRGVLLSGIVQGIVQTGVASGVLVSGHVNGVL